MKAFDEFLAWEAASKDTIDFKRAYVDVVGDVLAGLVLAELIYWHLPSKKTGAAKMKVRRGDHHWIACNRADWWERTRLTARQFDAALKLLTDASIVIKEVHGFAAKRALYVRINETVFLERLSVVITEDIYRYYPEVKPRRRPAKSQISDYGDKSQIGDLPPEINHKLVTSNTTTTFSSTTEKNAAIAARSIALVVKPGSYQATSGKSDAECEAERIALAEQQRQIDELRLLGNGHVAQLEIDVKHFLGVSGTLATKYARMLYGRLSTKGKKSKPEDNVYLEQSALLRDEPITPDEFTGWAEEYCRTANVKPGAPTMIKAPEKLVSSILARRDRLATSTNTNPSAFGASNWQPDFWESFDKKAGAK
jgi:hypothetical protein